MPNLFDELTRIRDREKELAEKLERLHFELSKLYIDLDGLVETLRRLFGDDRE